MGEGDQTHCPSAIFLITKAPPPFFLPTHTDNKPVILFFQQKFSSARKDLSPLEESLLFQKNVIVHWTQSFCFERGLIRRELRNSTQSFPEWVFCKWKLQPQIPISFIRTGHPISYSLSAFCEAWPCPQFPLTCPRC